MVRIQDILWSLFVWQQIRSKFQEHFVSCFWTINEILDFNKLTVYFSLTDNIVWALKNNDVMHAGKSPVFHTHFHIDSTRLSGAK